MHKRQGEIHAPFPHFMVKALVAWARVMHAAPSESESGEMRIAVKKPNLSSPGTLSLASLFSLTLTLLLFLPLSPLFLYFPLTHFPTFTLSLSACILY